ncbi:MAG: response regulator transcription factor [Lachnospiraceae bacterium]|nr:response regulator transcription factor [Lachnospiraceae bacterium]
MNLNFVIIEDNINSQKQLCEKLKEYQLVNPACTFQIQTFISFEAFLDRKVFLSLSEIHLIILDIELPGENGLEAARILRKQGYDGDILYFSNYLHRVRIITVETAYEQNTSFSTVKNILPESFCQCHRGIIVNMNHVECLDSSVLTLSNNEQLTVSKPYLKQIRNAFLLL